MRYCKRSRLWKSKNLRYDPENFMAFSYDWFCFLRNINGVIIFNITSVSAATNKHQRWVMDRLDQLGVQYLMISYFRGSLSGEECLPEIIEAYEREISKDNLSRIQKGNLEQTIKVLNGLCR